MLLKTILSVGTKVFLINGPVLSEWSVTDVISAGHSPLYKLQQNSTDSFCMYEASRLGHDMFLNKDEALKEFERRRDEKGKADRKKI